MRKSKFTYDEKYNILLEKDYFEYTVEEICDKYGISPQTFYNWRKELDQVPESAETKSGTSNSALRKENKTLRNLYINLSEHNYKLAQFLNKKAI